MELTNAQRKPITTAQAKTWPKATETKNGVILDSVVHVTGWHRDHARKMLCRAATGTSPRYLVGTPDRRGSGRSAGYGFVALLSMVQAVLSPGGETRVDR